MKDGFIYLVVGKSGSGKSYIVDKICREMGYKNTISKTERKPRYIGEQGHIFVDKQQADKEFPNAFAKTVYNGNRYYTLFSDLKDFYIIDVPGVKSIKNMRRFKIIYIDAPLLTRIKNMRKRGDSWKNIFSRIKFDSQAFRNFKYSADMVFKNSNQVYAFFKGFKT